MIVKVICLSEKVRVGYIVLIFFVSAYLFSTTLFLYDMQANDETHKSEFIITSVHTSSYLGRASNIGCALDPADPASIYLSGPADYYKL